MKTFLLIVAAFVLLIAAVIGYASYANHSAERAATAFCDRIEIGSPIQPAVARAKEQGVRYLGARTSEGREEHDFSFQGWVFNAGVCRVGVADGKVISRVAALEGD